MVFYLEEYLGLKVLQKFCRPTFLITISSKSEWAFLAEFLLNIVNFFKHQDIDSSSYSFCA